MAPGVETTARVKALLRRELKLAEDAEVNDDTPLIAGDFDLDSLDVLLIVTSVEREFGIRIPNEEIGRHAFRNVATLAGFIEDHVDS